MCISALLVQKLPHSVLVPTTLNAVIYSYTNVRMYVESLIQHQIRKKFLFGLRHWWHSNTSVVSGYVHSMGM